MTYQFADTDLAARRLELLASVFEPPTRQFLSRLFAGPADLALDLGCGVGHTTHLLAKATGYARAIGIDFSDSFISAASRTATDRVSFARHDVTVVPFPVGPADLIFCRFLLTHMTRPIALIERWVSQLHSSGHLMLEEVEWIHTDDPVLADYLDIVVDLLAANSQTLYLGAALDAAEIPGLAKIHSQVAELCVPGPRAAAMFHLNIQSWKRGEYIRHTYPSQRIEDLQARLGVTSEGDAVDETTWGLRQMVLART